MSTSKAAMDAAKGIEQREKRLRDNIRKWRDALSTSDPVITATVACIEEQSIDIELVQKCASELTRCLEQFAGLLENMQDTVASARSALLHSSAEVVELVARDDLGGTSVTDRFVSMQTTVGMYLSEYQLKDYISTSLLRLLQQPFASSSSSSSSLFSSAAGVPASSSTVSSLATQWRLQPFLAGAR